MPTKIGTGDSRMGNSCSDKEYIIGCDHLIGNIKL